MTGGDIEVAMAEARKVPKTEPELKRILTETLQDILRNNIQSDALRNTAGMSWQHVLVNRHLYERLGVAFAALGALRGYADEPRGYRLIRDPP